MSSQKILVFPGGRLPTEQLPDERALILSAQQGDASAFKVLYEYYRDRVFTLIRCVLSDNSHSEDVLQTVFVKAYRSLSTFRFESVFLTWLYRVALNECKNQRRFRWRLVPFTKETHLSEKPDSAPTPDRQQERSHAVRMTQAAIRELKPKYRAVIVLRYVDELSYEEIAETLECSTGTVASRLRRALEALERKLQPHRKLLDPLISR